MTRRQPLACIATAPLARAASRPVRLGGPIFLKSDDPVELAREHPRLGYSAAYCPTVTTAEPEKIRAIRDAFAAANVAIAEVGAWKNMLDPDAALRRENLQYVTGRLALADAVGARCRVDIAGSYNAKYWYGMNAKNLSQEFFDATVQNSRQVIDAVKPAHTRFTIEMMPWSLPDTPDSYVRLIKAVDRRAFGVHLDVCNVVNSPARFYGNKGVIEECFHKLGSWIASCHAKDLAWIPEYNVHFAEVVPGRGEIDYAAYLRELFQTAGGRAAHAGAFEERGRVRRGPRVYSARRVAGGRQFCVTRISVLRQVRRRQQAIVRVKVIHVINCNNLMSRKDRRRHGLARE